MSKERPLTEKQISAICAAEDTLFGDVKLVDGYGRQLKGLRSRGLVDGNLPHIYLTEAGKQVKSTLHT